MSAPYALVPTVITDAMLTSSTTAEPGAGETAWNAATSYVVGQEAILTSTHRVYTNLIAGVDATSPNLTLTAPTPRWRDTRATNRWAAFDTKRSNQTALVTPLTYVLRPGIFNAIAFYGLDGVTLTVSIKDTPGGTVVYTYTGDLSELPLDHYDYYFGRIRLLSKVLLSGINIYADPEVTISITAGAAVTVKAGVIAIGDLRPLLAVDDTGGTQYGASIKPVTTGYMSRDAAGNNVLNDRVNSTDMDIRIQMPIADVNAALATMQDVLSAPAAWIGSDLAEYAGLNAFGQGSGSVTYTGPGYAIISLTVRGLF